MNQSEIESERATAQREVREAMEQLKKDAPQVAEGLAASVGATLGAGGSMAALSFLGVSGLSAAGITSGLATAGALVGGGMVAGVGVLAAPVAILGIAGYALAKKRKQAKIAAALSTAISKLYRIQRRLMDNAEYYRSELAAIEATISYLESKQ